MPAIERSGQRLEPGRVERSRFNAPHDVPGGPHRRRMFAVMLTSLIGIGTATGAIAATTTVTIDDTGASPRRASIRLGDEVEWENQNATSHRIISTPTGFFETDRIEPGQTSDAILFMSSGTFPYAAPNNPDIHGAILVPVKLRPGENATPTPGAMITIRVGLERRPHRIYDVQWRRNDGDWVTIIANTKDVTAGFVPQRTGTFWFRARVTKTGASVTSKWSPPEDKFVAPPP
jgi:plastocyanin